MRTPARIHDLQSIAHDRAVVLAAATVLLLLRAAVAYALWRPGWSALTWDDFTRVAIAQRWAAQPFLASGDLVWLPLQAWVYGLGFVISGDLFADNPMLLAALVNSAAAVAAAALVGRAAWLLFESAAGGLIAFATILFAPWAVFTSLSGLAEPLYYLAIALVVWAVAARQRGGGLGTIAIGSLGVASAAAGRYEGWLLAPVWIAVVFASLLPPGRPLSPSRVVRALWDGRAALAVAAAPLLVPAVWMSLNLVRHGSALSFSAASAAAFGSAYGGEVFSTLGRRLAYYPAGLVRSAPVLLPLLVILAVLGFRHAPQSRLLTALVMLHFGLFYVTSLLSKSVGAFTERFMFAFVVALAPLLGMLPALIGRARHWPSRAAVTGSILALLLIETGYGLTHRLDEWGHPPDLLEVTSLLGDVARGRGAPLRVFTGDGFESDLMPLAVQNGRRLLVGPAPRVPMNRQPPPGGDVWMEKLPARIAAISLEPAAVIGRYHLYGPVVPPHAGEALGEWRRVDEKGLTTVIRPSRLIGLEFTADDPAPGAEALVERSVPRRDRPQRGSLAIRWLYGHGFNHGRILVEVRVDGQPVFQMDIATPSRWQRVSFEIPAGTGSSTVTVAVRASERIEKGWKWGRASTVVAKDLVIAPG